MGHSWQFFRAGGFDQVKLTRGADLLALEQLDQKLWVALACPVEGLEFDRRTLALIDTDGDQRVRATELIEAIQWAAARLADVETLAGASDALALSAICDTPEGRLIRETAEAILQRQERADRDTISVADTADAVAWFADQPANGDGILPEAAVADEKVRALVAEILSTLQDPQLDRGGAPGVDAASVAAFFDALAARAEWLDQGEHEDVRILGARTADAHATLVAVRGKIDDFFARCRIAAFDPRALEAINGEEAAYLSIAAQDLKITADEVAHFPIARVEAGASVPLGVGVNPAWSDEIAALRAQVIEPLLGDDAPEALDEATWLELCGRFGAYEAWRAGEAGASVAALDEVRIRQLLGSKLRARLEALIEADSAAAPMAEAIESVERLVRYCRDLMPLANNFVAFRDFYAPDAMATFQAGRLYIDQRACDLCIEVHQVARHATMAPLASAYLLYCDLRNAAGDKKTIVAAMTNGDVDNLMVGRNGVFYDRSGEDWDATVTKIVENPISVRQAFWTPYKRFLRGIEQLIEQRAAAAEANADARVTGAIAATDAAASGKAVEPPKPLDVGMIAALGVAVGGITAALGAMLEAFFGLGLWMPLGVVGLILLISGPSMAVAWLKLRQRNLGPLLDANGWAVNAQAKVNVPLGESLTQVAVLPPGSSRDLADPFAERRRPWRVYAFGLIVLLGAISWYIGALDPYLPGPVKSTSVLGELAPAANVPAPPPAEPAPEVPEPA